MSTKTEFAGAVRGSADYVLTRHNILNLIPGVSGPHKTQNNFRASVGIVFLLGRIGESGPRESSQRSQGRVLSLTALACRMVLSEIVSKRIDFANERRAQGRSLKAAVRELARLIQPIAQQHGIDLQAHLTEASARESEERHLLAKRLQESVVPLFISDSGGQPDRIGSCVLVRLDSDFFAFTAAHVIRDAASARLFAPAEGRGGKLLPLPPCTAHLSSGSHKDLDVGVLVLPTRRLGAFQQHVFLAGTEIDQNDRPDDQRLASFYFVLGYSASRTQVQVSRAERHIHQQSFHCSTNPVDATEYLQEGMSPADHVLLDFDHKKIVIGGRRANPPKLQGVSGGGVFYISRETKRGPLVAIATRNRRSSRLIVGTRIKHFLAMVRELKGKARSSELE